MKNINLAAIYHDPFGEYRYTLSSGEIVLMIRVARDDWDSIYAVTFPNYESYFGNDDNLRVEMYKQASDFMYDYYQVIFSAPDPRVKYIFELNSGSMKIYFTPDGLKTYDEIKNKDYQPAFVYSYAYPADPKPEWAIGAIGYQVFPDRFCRVGKLESGMEQWSSTEYANDRIFGGNIKGITSKVPYLKRLGIKVIYLNPIFKSNSSHRYNINDYFKIDPILGTEKDLKELCDTLHKHDMRIVLDAVFNHCGTGFGPFVDAMQRQKESKFYNWFFFGARESVKEGYAAFSFEPEMPKLNLKNPTTAEYFIEVGKYWIDRCDIDGWRIDVGPEVYPDFWRTFRKEIKSKKPDCLIINECWGDSRYWCNEGDMFDCNINYSWSDPVWKLFAEQSISIADFDARINRNLISYRLEVGFVQWNMIGSHDTARFLTRANDRLESLEAAAFFQLTSPGMPIIYYGDELGMNGGNDPECRKPMDWDHSSDSRVLRYYKLLSQLRRRYDALSVGDYKTYLIDDEQGIYAYTRGTASETMLCIICAKDVGVTKATIKLPSYISKQLYIYDEISQGKYNCSGSYITLPFRYGRCFCFPLSKTLDRLAQEEK